MDAHVAQDTLNRVIAQIAIAAMQLEAAVDHLESRIGSETLGLSGKPRRHWLALAHCNRGAVQQESRRLQLGCIVCNAELQRLEIGKTRAELLAIFHVTDGAIETKLCTADRTRANVQPSAIKSRHRDLEALPLGADAVRSRHAAVLEQDHRGRLCFPAELLFLRAK